MESAIQNAKIVPNIFSDHSAITLSMSLESNQTKRGPGFWKFNNSLLTDKCYTEMITKQIPEFISKYCNLNDKGLFWEMIKMEIRASTITFAENKAKTKLNLLQEKLRAVCCKDQLRSCNIEKTDFSKLCQNKGLVELVLKI